MADKTAKRLKKLGVALALILLPLALVQLLAAAAEGRLGWIIVASLVGAAAVAACLAGPKGPEVFRLFDCEEQAVTVRMYCPTRKARISSHPLYHLLLVALGPLLLASFALLCTEVRVTVQECTGCQCSGPQCKTILAILLYLLSLVILFFTSGAAAQIAPLRPVFLGGFLAASGPFCGRLFSWREGG